MNATAMFIYLGRISVGWRKFGLVRSVTWMCWEAGEVIG